MNAKKKILLIVLIVLFVIIAGVSIGYLILLNFGGPSINNPIPDIPSEQIVPSTGPTNANGEPIETVPLVDNPINFAEWQAINPDIYGWIYIPNTSTIGCENGINYPILCASDKGDDFYLTHNYHKDYDYSQAASIYSEKQNGRPMSSRNTLIYGHNMRSTCSNTMFGALNYFEDETFFEENDSIYIYIPGHILTYKIFAAYEYDDRHILNTFDFSNDAVWEAYLESAQNPQSYNAHTREVEISPNDRIVTLSTCVGYNKNARYLVQGVLVNDQPTT
ncbi:MAG: class B sortase [Clostridia bacterium]|nr:class B sortase [Clostridia bacterium]